MKIPFDKLTFAGTEFEELFDELKFSGKLVKVDLKMAKCEAKIIGNLKHYCDRCGKNINLALDEEVSLFLSNGTYKDHENELSDTIEFYDGEIDIDEIFQSEIESYKSDYFYCDECKILEGE
ncbi:hypothetical protein CIG11343_0197 [Campylobacter iguaniorum]|uniref:hypothetical protein n=1 Tax=Campylobacter iguaniorum TaxID=1244531 RepID=UPI0007C87E87|nr:hypothetical protein [Campylobacter iguaniorum]ANE35287.1 hypothetical protein CIG11343_0197 [Campylobacter iguaniorum]